MTAALAACGGGESPPIPPAQQPAPVEAPPPAPPAAASQMMIRGTIRLFPSAMFRSCEASALVPLVDSTGTQLTSAYRTARATDQDGLYFEGRAMAGSAVPVVITGIELTTRPGDAWGCDRPAPSWQVRVTGRNPAWSLTIAASGITYELPDSAVRIVFPAAAPDDSSGFRRYTTSTSDGGTAHTLHLLLEDRGCNIGSSGTWASMQARVVLDGAPMNGCASRGTEP